MSQGGQHFCKLAKRLGSLLLAESTQRRILKTLVISDRTPRALRQSSGPNVKLEGLPRTEWLFAHEVGAKEASPQFGAWRGLFVALAARKDGDESARRGGTVRAVLPGKKVRAPIHPMHSVPGWALPLRISR